MDLECLYQECANEQVRNFYKLHTEVFKSLAMDLDDLKQDILMEIWNILENNKGREFEKGIKGYIGGAISNHLRTYIRKAMVNYNDISLADFGMKGFNQSDEEILDYIKVLLKQDMPENAELFYNIFYKKIFIGKTDEQIVEDIIKEGIVESITRHRVSDIFWRRIVPRYRVKGRGLKYSTVYKKSPDETLVDGDTITKDSSHGEIVGSGMQVPVISFLFDDIKPLLSAREYEIIEKHFKNEMNFQQIADELSIRKQTVYIFYTRALDKLRKIVPVEV